MVVRRKADPMDDLALVRRIRAGDEDAPNILVDRYHGVVFGLCYRMMRHRQDAEDVVQDTFLLTLRGLKGFDAARPLRPWILQIAANRCRTAMGRRARRPIPVPSPDEAVDPRAGRDDPEDLAAELDRALDRLRPDYRIVFALYHDQGLPYEEIALVVGRPVGTVKTWLHRARLKLAESLARRGIHC